MRKRGAWAAAVCERCCGGFSFPQPRRRTRPSTQARCFGIDRRTGRATARRRCGERRRGRRHRRALVAALPGITDVAPIGRGDLLALTSTFAPGAHGRAFTACRRGRRASSPICSSTNCRTILPATGQAEGSDPFDPRAHGWWLDADRRCGRERPPGRRRHGQTSTGSRRSRCRTASRRFPTSVVIGPDGRLLRG